MKKWILNLFRRRKGKGIGMVVSEEGRIQADRLEIRQTVKL